MFKLTTFRSDGAFWPLPESAKAIRLGTAALPLVDPAVGAPAASGRLSWRS